MGGEDGDEEQKGEDGEKEQNEEAEADN